MKAVEDKDDRLALQARDRERAVAGPAHEVHGLLHPDGAQDNRTMNLFAGTPTDRLRELMPALNSFREDASRRASAGSVTDNKELAVTP